jgi:hypothetical protein
MPSGFGATILRLVLERIAAEVVPRFRDEAQ